MFSLKGATTKNSKAGRSDDSFRQARLDMVKTQIASRGIKDGRVLEAMREIPRHLFVPTAFAEKAYTDHPLPIGEEQTISQPYMVALMTELLELKGDEKVLEIGTGSGYQTALLSRLVFKVCTVERRQKLLVTARKILEDLRYKNIAMKIADGTLGWKDYAPYDAIMVTAGGPELSKPLFDQLRIGGRMVAPIGDEKKQVLHIFVKTPKGMRETKHSACTFVKLIGEYGWEGKNND